MRVPRQAFIAVIALAVVSYIAIPWPGEVRGPHRDGFGGRPLSLGDSAWIHLEGVLSVFSAVRHRSNWVLLDGRADRVHVLSADGTTVRSFGGVGDGPGELRHPAALAVTGDTLWVLNMGGTRIDGFTPEGNFVRRVDTGAICGTPFLDDVVATPDHLLLAVRCFGFLGDERHLVRVRLPGGTSQAVPWPVEGPRGVSGDLARLVATADGVLVGSMFHPCLQPVEAPTPLPLCLPPEDRVPLPDALRDSLQAAYDTRIPFLSREVSPYQPYFLDAAATPAGLVFLQPDSEDQTVLRGAGAEGPRVVRIPSGTLPFLVGDHLLLVEDTMDGVRIARASLAQLGL